MFHHIFENFYDKLYKAFYFDFLYLKLMSLPFSLANKYTDANQ